MKLKPIPDLVCLAKATPTTYKGLRPWAIERRTYIQLHFEKVFVSETETDFNFTNNGPSLDFFRMG
jgi:hypothetical protein